MKFAYFLRRKLQLVLTPAKMMSTEQACKQAREIFDASVRAVQPEELIKNAIKLHSKSIVIQGKEFQINQNVYIVGFGKAVFGMALALENMLKKDVVSSILSLPEGILKDETTKKNILQTSNIQIFEGARNNIPDNKSLLAASKITELVTSLNESHLLFVLISGGGSALLPSPKQPLTLEEKQKVIRLLASKGATIQEINTVRKRLSLLKGGGLAQLAKPTQVVSLILSDIIGDPLGLIASGPTVENTDEPSLPLSIIKHYKLMSDIPSSVIQLLTDISKENKVRNSESFSHVSNFIIGNNSIALKAAAHQAINYGYIPIIMTKQLKGIARSIGSTLLNMVEAALQHNIKMVQKYSEELGISEESTKTLLEKTASLLTNDQELCILFGGETTVEVRGKGIGGRNQELALASAIKLDQMKSKHAVVLLSAGTDGIDGPTDAAGALATTFTLENAQMEGLDAMKFLHDNDSYTFYSKFQNGQWLVKTGHTGTNVMDVIIILVKNRF